MFYKFKNIEICKIYIKHFCIFNYIIKQFFSSYVTYNTINQKNMQIHTNTYKSES